MTEVINPQTDQDFEAFIHAPERSENLIVVDFFATWCGPCKAIAPLVNQMSVEYKPKGTLFVKVDVDKLKQTAQRYSVTAMPTFIFFKGGQIVHRFQGGNPQVLQQAVQSRSQATGDSPKSEEDGDLYGVVETSGTHCLNQQEEHPVQNIWKKNDEYLESDADEQLLLTVGFRGSVKIHTVKLTAPKDERAPKVIKLYLNQPNMDFNDAQTLAPTQEVVLNSEDYDEEGLAVIALKYVKFQKVSSLSFFVESNHGAETSAISHLTLLGDPGRSITKVEGVIE